MSEPIPFPSSRVSASTPVAAGAKAASPAVSREAFFRWLPPELRPDQIARDLVKIAQRKSKDAARPTWAARKVGLETVFRERGIRGRQAFDLHAEWHRRVRAACALELAHAEQREADWYAFTQTDAFWKGVS